MDSTAYGMIRRVAREHLGLSLGALEQERLRTALEALLDSDLVDSRADLVERLRGGPDPALTPKLLGSLVSDETYFFRDQHPFVGLREEILVDLFDSSYGLPVNIWSAACASGQETYSLAMLIAEDFPSRWADGVHLVGSDACDDAIARAKEGVYTQLEVNRGLPAPYLSKYFVQHQRRWQIVDAIRRGVEFRRINLLDDLPRLRRMNVVVLRYVLTYYDEARKQRILDAVHGAMAPGGYLLLGGAETWANLHDGFELHRSEQTRYYRRVD